MIANNIGRFIGGFARIVTNTTVSTAKGTVSNAAAMLDGVKSGYAAKPAKRVRKVPVKAAPVKAVRKPAAKRAPAKRSTATKIN